jgi:polygalacturonase
MRHWPDGTSLPLHFAPEVVCIRDDLSFSVGDLPQAIYFRRCTHLVVEDLEVRDSMQMHVAIAYSWDVLVSKLFIAAPGWSPNTDGIHVSNSKEVSISDCTISTGTIPF